MAGAVVLKDGYKVSMDVFRMTTLCLKRVARGVALLIEKKPKRPLGGLKDKIKICKDFYDPLPEDIIASFELVNF